MLHGFGYSLQADIWSLGIVFYELLHGHPLFKENSLEQQRMKILKKINFNEKLDSVLIDLLKRMLEKNPEKRIDIDDVLNCLLNFKRKFIFFGDNVTETKVEASSKENKNSINTFSSHKINFDYVLGSSIKRNKKINHKSFKTKRIFKEVKKVKCKGIKNQLVSEKMSKKLKQDI